MEAKDVLDLISKLNFGIILPLIVGYLSYNIAYYGKIIKENHTLFIILIFTFISTSIINELPTLSKLFHHVRYLDVIIFNRNYILGVCLPIIIAYLWRRYIRAIVFLLMNKFKLTSVTGDEQVIHQLADNYIWSHVNIKCNDDIEYMCDVSQIKSKVWLPIVDKEGNVSMVITHMRASGEDDIIEIPEDIIFEQEGKSARLSYIPKEEIKLITVRVESKF